MNKINQAIAISVKKLRITAGLSQEELAEFAGIHRTYVSQVERGLKSPSIQVLIKIAEGLHIKASKVMLLIEDELDEL